MIKIEIPVFLKELLSNDILNDICLKSFNTNCFEINYVERSLNSGRYIVLQYNNITKYICLSNDAPEGRNSLIVQYLPTVYSKYYFDDSENKKMEIYMMFCGEKAKTRYQKFAYRMIKTLGIDIINISSLFSETIIPFSSYKEFKIERNNTRERNSGNNSSFFSDEGGFVDFYGKVYGANGKETALMCLVLSKITDKNIYLYQVKDHNTDNISENDKDLLKAHNIFIKDEVLEFDNSNININATEEELRDTPKFHYNLFKKFGDSKKCYLCGCDIENLIIGSHIHRVTDIKKSDLPREDKIAQIIDGNNGFWLCANHDKLFEYGLIYFDKQDLIISEKLNQNQRKFVEDITYKIKQQGSVDINNASYMVCEDTEPYGINSFKIKNEDYNSQMENYLDKHKHRVTAE